MKVFIQAVFAYSLIWLVLYRFTDLTDPDNALFNAGMFIYSVTMLSLIEAIEKSKK